MRKYLLQILIKAYLLYKIFIGVSFFIILLFLILASLPLLAFNPFNIVSRITHFISYSINTIAKLCNYENDKVLIKLVNKYKNEIF